MSIKLFLGLGNDYPQFKDTRHNVGMFFIQKICALKEVALKKHLNTSSYHAECEDFFLATNATYINESGIAAAGCLKHFNLKPSEICVVHDELELPCGSFKFKIGGATGGHNGLRSIERRIGSRDFCRLRIGISRPADRSQVRDYVVEKISRSDQDLINEACIYLCHNIDKIIHYENNMTNYKNKGFPI